MKILVTAGNTQVPIDKVRSIGNIFKGRTGTVIAEQMAIKNHDVTLLASHTELVSEEIRFGCKLRVIQYKTYDDLKTRMEELITTGGYDIIIHSAAVSDYAVDTAYEQLGSAMVINGQLMLPVRELDRSGKMSSEIEHLLFGTSKTEKIIDLIRKPWGFTGKLVKFKLQVGMNDDELIAIATRSMMHSEADIIVANTLEGINKNAFIIQANCTPCYAVDREKLPEVLMTELGL